jgi:hypothetical protein
MNRCVPVYGLHGASQRTGQRGAGNYGEPDTLKSRKGTSPPSVAAMEWSILFSLPLTRRNYRFTTDVRVGICSMILSNDGEYVQNPLRSSIELANVLIFSVWSTCQILRSCEPALCKCLRWSGPVLV